MEWLGSLYEYAVGRGGPPIPIGVEPDGGPCAAGYGGISADGSTVFFACGGAMFARIDNGEAGAHTVAISTCRGRHWGLLPKTGVFFTTKQELLPGSAGA